MSFNDKFTEQFAKIKGLFRDIPLNDDERLRILNTIHAEWRKWVIYVEKLQGILSEIGNWNTVREKINKTDDLMEIHDRLESFISVSHICNKMGCPVYEPLSKIRVQLRMMKYTSLEEAKNELGSNTVGFIRFKQKYMSLLSDLNDAQDKTWQMITVNMTKRYEKALDRENYIKALQASQEARRTNFLNINNAGPLEDKLVEMSNKFLGSTMDEKRPKGTKKTRAVGNRNIARMDEQYGKNLEKIRKKTNKHK